MLIYCLKIMSAKSNLYLFLYSYFCLKCPILTPLQSQSLYTCNRNFELVLTLFDFKDICSTLSQSKTALIN